MTKIVNYFMPNYEKFSFPLFFLISEIHKFFFRANFFFIIELFATSCLFYVLLASY